MAGPWVFSVISSEMDPPPRMGPGSCVCPGLVEMVYAMCWPVLSTIHAFCSPTKDSPSRPLGVAILVPPHPNAPPPPGLPSIRLPGNDKWSQKDVMKMGESPQHVFGLLHNQSVLT